MPSSTATHGASVGYEFSRHGYRIGGSVVGVRASILDRVGTGRRLRQRRAGRIGATAIGGAKDFLFGPFQSVHVGAAWYGGARLDRFSMYQFGLFDEVRMHGVPAAGIRFPELALAARVLLVQHLRHLSARPVPRLRARARPEPARPVAIGDRHRRGGDLQDAVEYDVHRRRRQELDPRPLSRDRIDRATVPPSQAVLTRSR